MPKVKYTIFLQLRIRGTSDGTHYYAQEFELSSRPQVGEFLNFPDLDICRQRVAEVYHQIPDDFVQVFTQYHPVEKHEADKLIHNLLTKGWKLTTPYKEN
jgi:hypothetical protein